MLDRYEDGADLTLLNNFYLSPKKDAKTGKWDKGSMTLIYRDNTTGKKYCETIEDPEFSYYISKDHLDFNALFIPEKDARKVTCKYRELEKSVAIETGNEKFYYDNIKNDNRRANKLLHSELADVFGSSVHIEDYYKHLFDRRFKNKPYVLNKAYFDIEADVLHTKGDFVEPGECPINAITIMCEKQKKVYTLLLRDPDNPQIEEFEKRIGKEFFDKIKKLVREKAGGWKNEVRYGLDKLEYNLMMYDKEDEINLIADLFKIINKDEPDFVLAWNMAFDIPYIIERIKVLGYDPEDIMCNKEFTHKVARYFVDELHKNDFEARGDFATIASKSVFMCQMIQFASRRKGQGVFEKFSLDYIGARVAKVRKLDYHNVSGDIKNLAWLDYETFVLYNIIDVVVQWCIEHKTTDIDYTFGKALMNNTRYSKTHRQTIYLINRAIKEFWNHDEHFILSNNHNLNNEKPTEKYPGAFVANPLKLKDNIKTDMNGRKIALVRNLDDYDYKSLYPSIMREFNIAPNTQVGRLFIEEQIWKDENKYNIDKFNRGGKFNEDFQSHNWIEFCKRWFKLADYSSLIDDIIEYYQSNPLLSNINVFVNNGMIRPIEFTNIESEYRGSISFNSDDTRYNGRMFFYHDYTKDIQNINQYYKDKGVI